MPCRRFVERATDAGDHGRKRHAPRRMGLRVEEDLGMDHVLRVGARQVGPGQVVEILLGPQHRRALVVEIEKILQLREAVGRARRLDGSIGQAHAVASLERQQHLRLERAFDVQMQLDLGQAFDEGGDVGQREGAFQ